MDRKFKRPKNKAELEQLEAEGLWKAIALTKKIGESKEKITLSTILRIHRVIFEYAVPEDAGRFRRGGEDVKKLKCTEPPPGRLVQERMYLFARELDTLLSKTPLHINSNSKTHKRKWTSDVFDLAAWIQYQVVAIHPFCDGNGRLARLMTNLVLRRYGFHASQVKIESENKLAYLDKLCQIDKHQDYEPLKKLIISSVIETMKKEEKLRKIKQSQKKY